MRNLPKLGFLGIIVLGACVGSAPTTPGDSPITGDQLTAGGPDNTFNHEMDERDPFDILKQKQEEGSPVVATRLHSCQKISYVALGNLLTSRGVDLDAKAAQGMPPSAGQLYKGGASALGAPTYAARTREPTQITAAGATKLMDVFVQAAPEVIAAMPTLKACQVAGQPTQMFDGSGKCTIDGISCLMGAPATQQHVALCNQAIADATSTQIGQKLAVAAILAAAHTCE